MAGSRKILVVDDDEDVREITAETLRSGGFCVVTAEDASAALDVLASREVAVVVTDVVMPGMNGFEFAQRARELRPGIRVLCVSGYSWAVSHTSEHCDKVLSKPWVPDTLTAEVTRLAAT